MFIGSNVSGFYNLKMSRSGVYSCLPVNRAGVGETATVNLTVVGKWLYCTSDIFWRVYMEVRRGVGVWY